MEVGFTTLTNTYTISAGTLSLFSWNELNSPTTFSLAAAAANTDATIDAECGGASGCGRFDPD